MTLHRYFTRLIWLAMAPVLLLAGYLAVRGVLEVERADQERAQEYANNFALLVDRLIRGQIAGLKLLAYSSHLESADSLRLAELHAHALGFQRIYGSHVILTDRAGRMLINTRQPPGAVLPPLPRPTGRAAAPIAFATGEPAVGDPVDGPVARTRLVAVAVPVLRDDKPVQVLMATLEVRVIEQRIASLALPAAWSVVLNDSIGQPIVRRAAAHGRRGDVRRVQARLETAPWSLMMEVPDNGLGRGAIDAALYFALLVAASAAIGMFAARRGARLLTRELGGLGERPVGGAATASIAEVRAIEEHLDDARRQREAAARGLTERENTLRMLIDHMPAATAMFDRRMCYLAVSRRWLADYDQSEDAIIGCSHYEIFPEIPERWREVHRRALAGAVVREESDRFERADGSVQWLRWEVRPWRQGDGEIGGIVIFSEDVTAQVEARRARRESEARLEEAQRIAGLGHWDWDIDRDMLTWSEQMYVQYGLDPSGPPPSFEEVKGFFSPEGWARLAAILEHAQRTGEPYELEAEILRRDGTRCWIAARGLPTVGEGGRVTHLHGTQQDITARKEAERRVAESEERYRVAFRTSPDAVTISAPGDGRIIDVNDGFVVMLGWPREEAIGRTTEALGIWADAAERDAGLDELREHGSVVNREVRLRTRDNRVLVTLLSAQNILLGGQDCLLAVTRDITARKEAERSLKESDERYRIAFRTSPDAVTITEVPTGRFLDVNEAYTRVFGWTRDEVVGRTPADIDIWYDPKDREPFLRAIVERGRLTDYEARFRNREGAMLVALVSSTTINIGGQLCHLSFTRDITERKRAEDAIRELNATLERRVAERTAELEQANRSKSDFLANMSHELRTPLNAIIGFSEMLKDGLLGSLDDRQRGFVGDIFESGTHLLSLINDVLDLSKVEAGMQQLELGDEDVASLLEATLVVVKERALSHRIALSTRIDPGVGAMRLDRRKTRQIVYNLLSNAVKFTPDGGEVTLAARRVPRAAIALDPGVPGRLVTPPSLAEGEYLEISVGDSGVGIEASQFGRLFESFVQLESATTRSHGGTGLGLALVRRLAELHGGAVGVQSRPGVGSRFMVWLPRVDAAGAIAAPASPDGGAVATGPDPARAPGAPKALVVEPDDKTAQVLVGHLRAEGFEVTHVSSAEEGLVHAARMRPDVLTLDIFLPGMGGWEFLSRFRSLPGAQATAVVIISMASDAGRGLALGARRVLAKPFTREELADALAGLIDTRVTGTEARVLVVDDNPKVVELIATVCGAQGLAVERAYTGAEAIEAARRAPPDLVTLDLMMPGMSGFEVARMLREAPATAHVPILVLTSMDLNAVQRVQLERDANVILEKASFSTADLIVEVRRALARREAR